MAKKRIGILTGGGDVPGLNAVIKTVTYRGSDNDIEVSVSAAAGRASRTSTSKIPASRRRYVVPLDRENTRTIDRRGGTVLHSSRTNRQDAKLPDTSPARTFRHAKNKGGIGKTWDLSRQVLKNLAGSASST